MSQTEFENGPLHVEESATLWRYVSLPTLLLYLQGTIRLSSIERLKALDPLEGHRLWDHVVQMMGFEKNEDNTFIVKDEYKDLVDYIMRVEMSFNDRQLFALNGIYGGENQSFIFSHWYKMVMSTRYALCFFESKKESMAMWRLYAPHGFAIKTSVNDLKRGLDGTETKWRISKMKYLDKQREVTADEMYNDARRLLNEILRRPYLLKSHEYEYENEVRLLTVDPCGGENLQINNVDAATWIKEILIAPDIWHSDANVMQDLIESRHPRFKGLVYQSKAAQLPGKEDNFLQGEYTMFLGDVRRKKWPPVMWDL